ncbi:hypothetical protein BGZ83_004834, partial [Gryganskiella cystojenkinii]
KKSKHGGAGTSEDNSGDEDADKKTIVAEAEEKKDNDDDDDEDGELIADEHMVDGKVSWKIANAYLKAMSYPKAMICIAFFLIREGVHVSVNLWLRYWISESEARDRDGADSRPVSYYLAGYAILVMIFMGFDVNVNYLSEVVCGIQAAKTLHNRLITHVLRLPMSFFDTTP